MNDDLTYVRNMLRICNVRQVAAESGIAYMTIQKIKTGETKSPSYEKVKALADYFRSIK